MAFLSRAEDILRRKPWTTITESPRSATLHLLSQLLFFSILYGAIMGTFGGISGDRAAQVLFAAIKVPILLLATFSISLPSFFVLNNLLGLREDFHQSMRALMATQAGLAIILASLAPFTLVWYASTDNYGSSVLFNGLMFATASFSAQWLLRGYYAPLIRKNPRHRQMMWTWVFIYAFVGIQMAWLLRPFVGAPNTPVRFFREEAWGNAYVVVVKLLLEVFGF
jgi:hypothetical protein